MTIHLPNPTPLRCGQYTAATKRAAFIVSTLLALFAPSVVHSQPMRDRGSSVPPAGAVELDLAGELELGILIDLISDRLGINIISSSSAESKKVRIRAPESIPDAAESMAAQKYPTNNPFSQGPDQLSRRMTAIADHTSGTMAPLDE